MVGKEQLFGGYPITSLYLALEPDKIHSFFPLLQQGFMVKLQVGCTIKMMLSEHLGLSPEYIEERIKTVFLDGKAVDDIDSTIIRDGSTLALSAAMPGLAGATLRMGGTLASFRSQISYREEKKAPSRRKGVIVVKLFNLIMTDLGPKFLKEGIYVRQEELKSFFMNLPEEFWEGCKAVKVNGQEVGSGYLLEMECLGYHLVMLRVDCEGS